MVTVTGKVRAAWLGLFAALAVLTAGQIWVQQHEAANTTQALATQRGSLATDVDTLRDQVTYCTRHPHAAYCATPAAPPPQVRISQHPASPVLVIGQPGDTGAAGQNGRAGATGKQGPGPTAQEIADAVHKYFNLHPVENGRDGPPGKDGAPGSPPPCMFTATQCVGPAGKDGTNGAPGKDGRDGVPGRDGVSVTDVHVDPNTCHLIVTFSDGHTQDAGQVACPTPTPTPTPTAPPVITP